MHTLAAHVEAHARAAPGRIALVEGERSASYAQLWASCMGFADVLRASGLQPGDRVAIVLPNRIEAVVALYGTWLAGGVAVPLNVQARERDLSPWLAHCGASCVVHEAGHEDAIAALRAQPQAPVAWALQPGQPIAPEASAHDASSAADTMQEPASPALILYTSGTTGAPKGVTLSHANLLANARAVVAYLQLDASDSVLGMLPFYYAYGASVLHTHLLRGARAVIASNQLFPHALMETVARERITGLSGVPSTFALLLERLDLRTYDLSALRYVTQAGGAMTPSLTTRLRAALPGPRLFVMYGQTEATSRLTWLPPEALDAKLGSVGLPVGGTQLRIVREDGSAVACDEEGEVEARGPGVMLGYWNAPEATAATLRDGWLRTGDLGRLDADGFLYLAGRRSDMIKTGAHRVHPGDIEEAIAELAAVSEVAVVGVADDVLGQVPKAFVVLRETASPARGPAIPEHAVQPHASQELAIKSHCRARLPPYKIPRFIEFVDALPKTASGKVRRVALSPPMATAA
jgi:long-chain acyl-CoA synthetase